MGLDINLFRTEKGGNPDIVRESQRRRYKDPSTVDAIIEKDEEWRKSRYNLDILNREFNKANKEVANKKKESKGQDPCTAEIEVVQTIKQQIEEAK